MTQTNLGPEQMFCTFDFYSAGQQHKDQVFEQLKRVGIGQLKCQILRAVGRLALCVAAPAELLTMAMPEVCRTLDAKHIPDRMLPTLIIQVTVAQLHSIAALWCVQGCLTLDPCASIRAAGLHRQL